MLPKRNRIESSLFPGITRGKVAQNDLFRVVIRNGDPLRNPKCAVIVSKKVAKTAVSRNRIRRQVYSALDRMMEKLPVAYISIFPKKAPMEPEEVISGLRALL